MKKLILFVFVFVVGDVNGQSLPCSVLPNEFGQYCNSGVWLDTLDFTNDSSLIEIDTSNSCLQWQIGHSYKPVFDSITSPFGIATDTISSYLTNVKCSFIIKQQGNLGLNGSLLFFEHKYESDSLFDGGYIEYSCDYGQNWRLINGYDWQINSPPQMINYYNYLGLPWGSASYLHDTIPAFTGSNENWQWSGIQILWYLPVMRPDENRWEECWQNTDTLYYRFTFESDSVDSGKAGWMIRKIVIGGNGLFGSISEFSSLPLKLFPNPATEKVSIELPPNAGALSSVVISDIAGNVALRATEEREIDVSTLSPGIYFVLVETDKFVFRQKLVKQ